MARTMSVRSSAQLTNSQSDYPASESANSLARLHSPAESPDDRADSAGTLRIFCCRALVLIRCIWLSDFHERLIPETTGFTHRLRVWTTVLTI